MTDLDAAIRARLDKFDASMDATGSLWGAGEMRAAIEAVLDLHSPCRGVHVELGTYGCKAPECQTKRGHVAFTYPCPTVRVIAEKLGVEVDGG